MKPVGRFPGESRGRLFPFRVRQANTPNYLRDPSEPSEPRLSRIESFLDVTHRDPVSALTAWRLWTMLGWNDIRQRYRRSTLGPFWITLSVAFFIVVLGEIYSRIFHVEWRSTCLS